MNQMINMKKTAKVQFNWQDPFFNRAATHRRRAHDPRFCPCLLPGKIVASRT